MSHMTETLHDDASRTAVTAGAIAGGEAAARAFAARRHGVFIDGEVVHPPGERIVVEDPATEEPLAEVPLAGAGTVDQAVAAARAAFDDGRWSRLDPVEQEAILRRLAGLVEQHADELAWLELLDNGKAMVEARGDVAGTARVLHYYAGWPTKLRGDVHATDRRFLALTVHEPVGVCGQIIPWNYPLLMASWKLGPALAAGNAVVLKPAEQTPLSALRVAELCLEAGIPPGVVNVVTGDGTTGAALAAHRGLDKVAFTGSTEAGRSVMAAASHAITRVTLELGGKNPNVVFADADLDAAVEGALAGAFENAGQACIAGSRLLVERAAHDEVVARVAERARAIEVGPGWREGVELGPLVSAEQRARVLGYVEGAAAEGAALVTGDAALPGPGHYVRPAVVGDVSPAMRIFRDEVFGPVVTVTPFEGDDEAVALANDTRYGLAAAVWTRDGGRAIALARRIRSGTVWVNAYGSIRPEVPFGGFGESGLGRELGAHGLAAYTEPKSLFVSV
jgi:phenylacetaldehyde dehydrogenase